MLDPLPPNTLDPFARFQTQMQGSSTFSILALQQLVPALLLEQLDQVPHLLGSLPVSYQQRIRCVDHDQIVHAQ